MSIISIHGSTRTGCIACGANRYSLTFAGYWEKNRKMYEINRIRLRNFLSLFTVAFVLSGTIVNAGEKNDQASTHDIQVAYNKGDFHNADSRIVYDGMVIIQNFNERDKGPESLRLVVDGTLKYGQRFTGKTDLQAIRHYRDGSFANIQVAKGKKRTELGKSNRYVIARSRTGDQIQHASLGDVLKQSELELIQCPADPLCFPAVFNRRDVKVGDRWQPSPESLATFLSVDRVYDNEVDLQLKSVNNGIASIHILGTAKAEIHDAITELDISGKILMNLDKKLITSVRASIKQDRTVGQIAPGLKGVTKIDLKYQPSKPITSLANAVIAKVTKAKKIERRLKWEADQAQFWLTYDPRWHLIASDKEAAVLRFLDQGELLGQCNIVQLPARPAKNPLAMAQFKDYIAELMADEESARIEDFQQAQTPQGLRSLKVKVEGSEQGVPVTWIYYHIENEDGRRVTMVFTCQRSTSGQFFPADQALVNSFAFGAAPTKPQKSASTEQPFKRTR